MTPDWREGNPSKRGLPEAGEAVLARDPVLEALFTAEETLCYGAWTQGAVARDSAGEECHWFSESGAKYSLEGALLIGTAYGPADLYDRAEALVVRLLPPWAPNLVVFNDAKHMTVSGVKKLLMDAVTLAKQEEK